MKRYRTIVADPPWRYRSSDIITRGSKRTASVESAKVITWEKQGALGMGFSFRNQTEHILFGVRGDLPIPPAKRERTIFAAPRGRHSEKPDSFMDMVERVSPGPYLEMFARRARFGWDYWGDQSLGTAEMPEAA